MKRNRLRKGLIRLKSIQPNIRLGREKAPLAVEPLLCGRTTQLMISPLKFPTELHREVAELAGDFFSAHAQVDTLLVVNSCARGRAVTGSDLDLAVLITPTAASQKVQSLETMWQEFSVTHPLIRQFRNTGRFTQLLVDVFDHRIILTVWYDGVGPDNFEVEIGNR